MTTLVCPAATTPTFWTSMAPREVTTRSTEPELSLRISSTSQFWMMSTPSASAARA